MAILSSLRVLLILSGLQILLHLLGLLALLLLLTGCAAPTLAPLDTQRGIVCVTVDTLTTRATTVYVQSDRPGSVVVQAADATGYEIGDTYTAKLVKVP